MSIQPSAGSDVFVIDVSSAQLVLRLEGDRARELLASGCGVDLRPDRFAVNQFAQTRLGPFAVLIHRTADFTYDVHVERSLGESMHAWLELNASSLTEALQRP
ncbi:sarcosine oxidase subunit gamma family protein [Ottowia thiooxydans]